MINEKFVINLKSEIGKKFAVSGETDLYLEKLQEMNLTPLEEKCLVVLFPQDLDNAAKTFDQYGYWLKFMRGQGPKDNFWISAVEISNLTVDATTLSDPNFFLLTLRSVYLWLKTSYPSLAIALVGKFKSFTAGSYMFADLPEPYSEYYRRICLLLFEAYYQEFSDTKEYFLFSSAWIVDIIRAGLDVDKMAERAVLNYWELEGCQEFSRELAACLLVNETEINSANEKLSTVKDWVYFYREACGQAYNDNGLLVFKATKEFDSCLVEEQAIIEQLVVLYKNLITGEYAFRDITMDEILADSERNNIKPSMKLIKYAIEKKFTKKSGGQLVEVDGIMAYLSEVAEKYNDKKIEELYYYDVDEGKFCWNEAMLNPPNLKEKKYDRK